MKMTLPILCLLFAGCGTVMGPKSVTALDEEGYSVSRKMDNFCSPGIASPSVCIATLTDVRKGVTGPGGGDKLTRMYITPASTAGILPSLIGAGAAVGASVYIGKGLEKSGSGNTSVEVNSTSSSGAAALQSQ